MVLMCLCFTGKKASLEFDALLEYSNACMGHQAASTIRYNARDILFTHQGDAAIDSNSGVPKIFLLACPMCQELIE